MLYTDEPHFNNPFHVHELYFDEFKALLENYFRQVKFLGQRIYCTSNMWPIFPEQETHPSEFVVERTPKEFTFVPPEKRAAIYFIAVASNAAKPIDGHLSFLVDISNDLIRARERAIAGAEAQRDNLKATLSALERQLSALEGQNANFQATTQAQQRLIVQKQEQVLKLNELLKQKEQRLSDLSQELEKLGIITPAMWHGFNRWLQIKKTGLLDCPRRLPLSTRFTSLTPGRRSLFITGCGTSFSLKVLFDGMSSRGFSGRPLHFGPHSNREKRFPLRRHRLRQTRINLLRMKHKPRTPINLKSRRRKTSPSKPGSGPLPNPTA